MANDWDLHAIVRSCSTAFNTTNPNINISASRNHENTSGRDPFSNFYPLRVEDHQNPFCFPNLIQPRNTYDPFDELSQIVKPFLHPNSSLLLHEAVIDQQQHQRQQLEQQQQQPQRQPRRRVGSRSRRRRNQQKRVVYQVTSEAVASDVWAWRKYGQKPIKGSPYPRNYYRCSSSKACSARKQVERHPSNPGVFIITLTGDHVHPRPISRNLTLVGSSRRGRANSSEDQQEDIQPDDVACVASLTSPSPTTPLVAPNANNDNANLEKCVAQVVEEGYVEETMEDDDENANVSGDEVDMLGGFDFNYFDDEHLLIPNMEMNEDFFRGLQELGSCSPIWTQGSSSTANTASAAGSNSGGGEREGEGGAGEGH